MENKSLIEKNIQDAMDCIVGIKRADPGPFFYTRLQARLSRKEKNIWENITGVITRPTIAIFSVLAVVLLNTVVLIKQSSAQSLPDQSDMAIVDEYKQAISFYDLENDRP